MKKIFALFFSVLLMFAFSCSKNSDVVKKGDKIKIGFMGPMTGDASNYGKLMSQAVKIAVEEKNATGGIDGHEIELIVEDDEGKVEKANPAIEKLASVDKVYGFVGPVFSSCGLAVAPKAQAAKIVMISPSSTHKDLTSKGNFIFRNVLSDQLQAIVFAKFVKTVMGVNSVAVIYLKNDYSQGLAEDFKKQFEKDGGKITAMESGLQGDKDFKTQLTKIKGTNPEALYMPCYTAEMAQILEQAKQLGLNVKIISSDGYSSPEIFTLAKDLANGVIFANSAEDTGSKNDIRSSFEAKYLKKWGEKPDAFSLNSYDAANMIINAVEKSYLLAKKDGVEEVAISRDQIREIVAGTENYEGVSGNITFMKNSGDAIKNVGIFIADKNEFKQLAVYKIANDELLEIK